jgi:hypothetical protein
MEVMTMKKDETGLKCCNDGLAHCLEGQEGTINNPVLLITVMMITELTLC